MPPHNDPHDHPAPSGSTGSSGSSGPTGSSVSTVPQTGATFSMDSSFSAVITETNAAQTVTGKINVIDPDAGQACLDLARTLGYSTASSYYKTGEATQTGSYYGSKTIFTLLDNNTQLAVISDGDPYPAKAGYTILTNDLSVEREWPLVPNPLTEQDFEYKFTYRGGNLNSDASYSNFFSGTSSMGVQGIFLNGVALYNPSSGSGTVPGTTISGNNTYNLNAVFFEQQYGIDESAGHPSPEGNDVNGSKGQMHYHDPMFLTSDIWNNETFAYSNTYFSSDYYTPASGNIDYIRHANGHSKIVGFCFDGYPIYGPYGYDGSFNSTSPSVLMTTSYRTKTSTFPGRPYSYNDVVSGDGYSYTIGPGAFLDDYEYVPGRGSLDDCNGRFCVTPEYPNGTYAYFCLINEADEPVFPYILGKYSRQQRTVMNGGYPADSHNTDGSVIPTTGTAGEFNVSTLGVSKYVSAPINETIVDVSYGSFTIDSSGNWSYTMDGPHDEFVTDVSYNDSMRVYSYDGSANRLVTVTMMGTAEAPVGPTPTLLDENNADTQDLTYSLNSPAAGEATVSGYSGLNAAAIVIPAQVVSSDGTTTYNVVKIGDYIFMNRYISSITFNGNNLTSIGNAAFENCRMPAVTIPDSVTSIGDNVFQSCSALTAATIGNALTSIPWGTFSNCSALTTVALGNAIATITDNAINYSQLSSLTVGSGNTTFFNGPNNELYQIIESNSVSIVFVPSTAISFTIPSTYNGYSVTTIGTNAFNNRAQLTSVNVSASVTNIPSNAFNGCSLLTNVVIDAANTMYAAQDGIIYQKVDADNASVYMVFGTVTNVNIPDTIVIGGGAGIPVTSIPDWLFSDRTSLTAVSIGNNVSYIGSGEFNNTRIESISIPASVTLIEFMAFSNNPSLTSVTFAANSQLTTLRSSLFENTKISTINIPNSVVDIQDGVFNNCLLLTNVTIPYSVTSMRANTFSGCALLTDLSIDSANATYVEQDGIIYQKVDAANAMVAFGLLSSLTSANMQSSVSIGAASIPVTSIGINAFNGCIALTAVTIPDAVTSIGNGAFSSCIALTAVTIPNTVTSIGDYAFNNCPQLTSVTIGNAVTSIGEGAFRMCGELANVYFLGDNVTSTYNGGQNYDFFEYQQFTNMPATAVAHYVDGKSGWGVYNSSNPPAGFSNIQTFVPEGSGPTPTASAIRACLSCNPNSSSLNIINVTGNNGTVVYKWLKDGTLVGTDLTFDYITPVDCVGSTLVAQVGDDDGYVTIATMTIGTDCKIALVIADTYVNIIPNSNNENKAFYYGFRQNDLTSVVIGNAVTSIGDHAFSGNLSLVDVTIGPSVGYIENWAFGGNCPGITSITIPDATTNINNYAFNQMDAGTHNINTFHIGAGLQDINSVKNSNNYVTTLTISPSNPYLIIDEQGVVYVKVDANNVVADFVLYDKTSVIIPATVTFDGAVIPVTSINWDALTNVTSLTIDPANTTFASQDGIIYQKVDATNATITKVFGTVTNVVIPDTIAIGGGEGIPVTSISDWLFSARTSLTAVSIGNNVSYIGGGAFNNTRIESISIPASVTNIEYMAFSNNPSLTSVTFAANSQLTTLRSSLFENTKISTINIPASVTNIQYNVFKNCLLLTNVIIPSSVTSIHPSAFTGCALLTDLAIDSANTTYVEQDGVVYQKVDSANAMVAFGLSSLTSANMPSSVSIGAASIPVTSIGQDAFNGSSALTAVTIGANVTSIVQYAFLSCSVLTVVTMGANVTSIGRSAFEGCIGLTAVTIPASVTYIDERAFYIASLKDVYFLGDNETASYYGQNYDFFGYGQFVQDRNAVQLVSAIASNAVAYYVATKTGWGVYSSDAPPAGFSDIQTFDPEGSDSAPDHSSGPLTVADGDEIGNVSGGNVTVSSGTAAILSTGGTFALALNGGNADVTTLNGSVAASVSIGSGKSLSTSAGTFAGALSGAGTLKKTGPDTLTLSGTNSGFSGAIQVTEGTLKAPSAASLGSGAIQLGDGLPYNEANVTLVIESTTADETVSNPIQALSAGFNNLSTGTGTGVVTLTGGVTKNGTPLRFLLGSYVVDSDITGSSANSDLLLGDGTTSSADVTLVSGNTYEYNGPTTVNTGSTLTLQDGVALPDSDVTINAGATLVLEYTTSTITANSVNSLTLSGTTIAQWGAGIYGGQMIVNISSNLTAGDYTVLAVNTFGIVGLSDIQMLDPIQVNYTGSNGSSASITQDSNLNYVVTITAAPIPTSNVCFPAKTPVITNLGPVNIEDINPAVHTIRNKKIVAITKTVAHDKNLVRIAKHALGHLYPEKTTFISQNHKVFCQGQMIKAKHLVDEVKGVTFVPYNGQVLYNVLLEEHEKMQVNNLIVETLHPEHKVAKLYRFLKNVDAAHHGKFIAAFNKKDLEQRLHR